ncbi:hypothetical protein [Streptomyces albireticuli]|uniref:hypothetical protein n=1 Tax=Streptomyces albireticuli TaxID=1940 RepID=UPI001331B24E|nr:hypothetical protein [Streptomyces albireticuli]
MGTSRAAQANEGQSATARTCRRTGGTAAGRSTYVSTPACVHAPTSRAAAVSGTRAARRAVSSARATWAGTRTAGRIRPHA